MKTFKSFIIASFIIVMVIGCEKNKVYEPGWEGKWEVYQVDSAWYRWWEDSVYILDVRQDLGTIEFSEDSTGSFEFSDSNRYHCLNSTFSWSSFGASGDTILLTYPSGQSIFTWAIDMKAEELVFGTASCGSPPGVGSSGGHNIVHTRRIK